MKEAEGVFNNSKEKIHIRQKTLKDSLLHAKTNLGSPEFIYLIINYYSKFINFI